MMAVLQAVKTHLTRAERDGSAADMCFYLPEQPSGIPGEAAGAHRFVHSQWDDLHDPGLLSADTVKTSGPGTMWLAGPNHANNTTSAAARQD
jgi:hypothetical protein